MRIAAFLFAATVMSARAAYAQSEPLAPTTVPSTALPCADFRHNTDGSWTALVALTITNQDGSSVQISPNTIDYRAGYMYSGLDLGALLDQQCAMH
jgi:hypothetical protein